MWILYTAINSITQELLETHVCLLTLPLTLCRGSNTVSVLTGCVYRMNSCVPSLNRLKLLLQEHSTFFNVSSYYKVCSTNPVCRLEYCLCFRPTHFFLHATRRVMMLKARNVWIQGVQKNLNKLPLSEESDKKGCVESFFPVRKAILRSRVNYELLGPK